MQASRRGVMGGIAASVALPMVAGAQPAPKRGGVLKISVNTRTTSVNPLQISGPSEYIAIDMLFSGLLRMGADMKPQPDLALDYTSDAEAKIYTFRLRPNVTFHDGTPFTSADVVATYRAILDPKTASPAKAALGSLQEIEAIDPLTVRFTCAKSFADFPVSTSHANARIVSAAALKDLPGMATKANGTGPFKQDVFDSTRLLRVVRNPAYFVPELPYVDAVELPLFPDLTAEVQNLLSGTTDVMFDVQQADYKRIAAAPGVVGQRIKSGRFVNVVMRMDTKPFDDVRVRNALAMAIDRDTLVDLVLEGLGQVAGDDVISPQYRYYSATPAPVYDPAAAKKLLAAESAADLLQPAGHPLRRGRGHEGDDAGRRVRHRRADHPARYLPGECVDEGQFLRRLLGHAGDRGRGLHPALHLQRRLRRHGLEQ